MPTYDYVCTDCGHQFEEFQSMSADPLELCPVCEGKVKRVITGGTGLIFKGSGFYITDYQNQKNTTSKSNDASDNSSEKSTEKKKSESSDSSASKSSKSDD